MVKLTNSDKVTIGLPFYNAEKTLGWALQSICVQTYANFHLILIDDASDDTSYSIAEQFRNNDSRIRLIKGRKNRGLASRLNQITSLTRTDILFRMDADDIMFPNRLEIQTSYMRHNPRCDLVGSTMVIIDEENRVKAIRNAPSPVATVRDFFKRDIVYHPSICGRTNWFRTNPYEEALRQSEDYELWCRTAASVNIQNIDTPLIFYREQGSFSYKKYTKQSAITKRIVRKYGPDYLQSYLFYCLQVKRWMKDLLYLLLDSANCWHLTLLIHNQHLPHEQQTAYQKIVNSLIEQRAT